MSYFPMVYHAELDKICSWITAVVQLWCCRAPLSLMCTSKYVGLTALAAQWFLLIVEGSEALKSGQPLYCKPSTPAILILCHCHCCGNGNRTVRFFFLPWN
jgi:hypothetical protein